MSQDVTGGNWVAEGPPADFSDSIFARRLREVRQQARTTQQQLAERMTATGHKMHRSAIAKIEVGDRPVSIGEAVQLAGILGVPLMELVTDRGSATEQEKLHRTRVEAQIAVRSLQHEAAERHKLLQEAQVLYENATDRLEAARKRLAELGGGAAWDSPGLASSDIEIQLALAEHSTPLGPGKDDQ
jgi:transcriptional regulator with XRE-family HTH domain